MKIQQSTSEGWYEVIAWVHGKCFAGIAKNRQEAIDKCFANIIWKFPQYA